MHKKHDSPDDQCMQVKLRSTRTHTHTEYCYWINYVPIEDRAEFIYPALVMRNVEDEKYETC